MLDFIRYQIWPPIKVRLTYWWWIIRYGGKKNIPKEVVFRQLEKSVESMADNLEKAINVRNGEMDHQEAAQAIKIAQKVKEFKEEIKNLKK
jgi:hypothetical protein